MVEENQEKKDKKDEDLEHQDELRQQAEADADYKEPEPEKKTKVFQGTVNGKPYKGAKLSGLIKGRCSKCNHDFEQNLAPAGEIVNCPRCQNKGIDE